MSINEKKIILISGDPNSINSEIIYKSYKNLITQLKKYFLITNFSLFQNQLKKLKYHLNSSKLKILMTIKMMMV